MKKILFTVAERSLLERLLAVLPVGEYSKADVTTAARIRGKLEVAALAADPAVNAPAIEDALIAYSGGKVAALALPNWARYARQGAQAGATVADAQTIGQWMRRQDWIKFGSQTLQSALNNWSSWLGKARAEEAGAGHPKAGLNGGNLGQSAGPQRQVPQGGRAAPGLGRAIASPHPNGVP